MGYTPIRLKQTCQTELILSACMQAAEELGLEARVRDLNKEKIKFGESNVQKVREYDSSTVHVSWHGIPYCRIEGFDLCKGRSCDSFGVSTGFIPFCGVASEKGILNYLNRVQSYIQEA